MQKLVYLSNSRDYTEQGNINENRYFKHINELLEQGWKVEYIKLLEVAVDNSEKPIHKETSVAYVLLEKSDEQTQEG
ncbi:MAG: hypothetical protein FWF92_11525 [Oscillospiraceae bacterium]|nr:hypothetical protein [Oscillospiraceae bacterium]